MASLRLATGACSALAREGNALRMLPHLLLAAAAYERTGWFATPIAAHLTYNAVVLGSSALR